MTRLTRHDRKYLEAAGAWLHLGNVAEAAKELDNIDPKSWSNPEALSVRWEICAKSEKWERALDIATTLITMRPTRVNSWVKKALALKKLGHLEEARTTIRLARESNDWPVDDLQELASEAIELGDQDEALACIRAGAGKHGFPQLKALSLITEAFAAIHERIRKIMG